MNKQIECKHVWDCTVQGFEPISIGLTCPICLRGAIVRLITRLHDARATLWSIQEVCRNTARMNPDLPKAIQKCKLLAEEGRRS